MNGTNQMKSKSVMQKLNKNSQFSFENKKIKQINKLNKCRNYL